jgi:hypothetical protein
LGSIVTCEVSSDGTLPSPLTGSTTYYVIYVSSTLIKLALTLSDAINNIPVDITTSGSGTHRIFRRSTAKVRLAIGSPIQGFNSYGNFPLKNGLVWFNSLNEAQSFNRSISTYRQWTAYCPDSNTTYYHYRSNDNKDLLCKWNFWTLESGQDIIERYTSRGVYYSGYVWMSTNTGLARLDVTNDSIVDYTVANGLLVTKCTDVSIDEVTGTLWIGHETGMTSFNTSTFTVMATYTNGTGNALDGLTNDQVWMYAGNIKVYNNLLIKTPVRRSAHGNDVWIYNVTSGDFMLVPSSVHTGYSTYQTTWEIVGDGERAIVSIGEISGGYLRIKEVNFDITAGTYVQVSSIDIGASGLNGFAAMGIKRFNKEQFLLIATDSYYYEQACSIYYNRSTLYARRGSFKSYQASSSDWRLYTPSYAIIDGVLCAFFGSAIMFSDVPFEYGCTYTGGNYVWSREDTNSIELPNDSASAVFSHSSFNTLSNNLVFNPENAGGFNSNLQFISGENAILTHGPGMIKTNLQTASFYASNYMGDLKKIVKSINIPGGSPYTFTIDQAPGGSSPIADFKGMEAVSYYLIVNHSSEGDYLQVSSNPATMQYTATEAGLFTFSSDDAGKPLTITYYYLERH